MSIKVMNAVWDQDDLDPTEKLIMLALADWANDSGRCWPSIAQLTKKSGCAERTVYAVIGRLEGRGYLGRDPVPGRGVNYIVRPLHYLHPPEKPPLQQMQRTPAADAPNTSDNHQPVISTPTLETTLPEQSKEITGRKPAIKIVQSPDCITPQTWRAWIQMRREIKHPATERAQELMAKKLAKLEGQGWIAEKLLERSIFHSWQDVYPPKPEDHDYSECRKQKEVRIDRW